MPIYEYRCDACRRSFEELVMSASTRVTCPLCKSARVERQLSVFSTPSGSWTDCGKPATEATPCARGGGCACH